MSKFISHFTTFWNIRTIKTPLQRAIKNNCSIECSCSRVACSIEKFLDQIKSVVYRGHEVEKPNASNWIFFFLKFWTVKFVMQGTNATVFQSSVRRNLKAIDSKLDKTYSISRMNTIFECRWYPRFLNLWAVFSH